MIKAIIIDDEAHCIDTLSILLAIVVLEWKCWKKCNDCKKRV
jgi:hypothetical protein